jgi:tetratricopeptide (TPR) repeat protein
VSNVVVNVISRYAAVFCVFCSICRAAPCLAAAAQGGDRGTPANPPDAAAASNDVARGIAALHLFEYEDANDTFRRAQSAHPDLVLAFWGEAMTYDQILWRKEDIVAGRDALRRLGASRAARLAKAATATERNLLDAADALFGEGDSAARHQKYADAMARAYEQDPENADVAAFFALALMGTVSRSLIGYEDAHEGHVHGLAGSPIQARVAAILGRVLQSHPDHTGALHYLIHDYDDPEHAAQGLAAARRLAALAPDSSHARHMPSHIFLQLGMWRDAAASDRGAFDQSTAWVERRHYGPAVRNYHALSWLEYELLQRGKYGEAWSTIGELEPVVKATGQVPLLSTLSSMRARFVVETRRWSLMANETSFANVNDLFAIGISAARSGNNALASRARDGLAARAQSASEGDLRPVIAIMEREVSALIQLASGYRDDAIRTLQAASRAELDLPPPLGLPQPVKPAPELLGEVLVEIGRAREAIERFGQTLRRHPNRSLSVLGLARAHAAVGELDASRRYYRELLANFSDADGDLPELNEARHALENRPAPASHYAAPVFAVVVAAAAVTLAIVRKRQRPRPASRPAQKRRAGRQHPSK